jgi:glycine/D-amino acid oxidase-like deaminating enzyme
VISVPSSTVASVSAATPRSYWLDRDLAAPALGGDPVTSPTDTDLLVVGGGLTGLWAAFEAASAGREVLVVDAGAIGGGASGRCGGFINASITHGIAHGHARWPGEMHALVALQQAIWDDTLRLLDSHGTSDIIQPAGKFTVATSTHHLDQLAASIDVLRHYGQTVRQMGPDEVRAEVNSPTYLGGFHHVTANGVCDPVRLVHAIAGLAASAGARFAEHTRVDAIDEAPAGLVARTSTGASIKAGAVLLATNAYRPLRRQLRMRVIPVYDHVITTEPLSAAQWDAIGWREPVGVTDAGNQFHYYRRTSDDRILFGGWDATYHFGGRVDERLELRDRTHQLLARHLLETFPVVEGTAISHRWGGPIDSTSRFTPMFGTAMDGRLGWSIGFTGLGVGASRFGALTALDLLAGERTARTELSMVRRSPLPFPPEPVRWPVVQLTKRALAREDRTGRRGVWLRLLDRFGVGFDT